jgi:hypothetical protein
LYTWVRLIAFTPSKSLLTEQLDKRSGGSASIVAVRGFGVKFRRKPLIRQGFSAKRGRAMKQNKNVFEI